MSKKIAFIFPGQGSQSLGMLAELSSRHPQVNENFSKASEILGYDLWQVCQNGPEQRLNQTEVTQPALLVASYCVWQIWQQETNIKPDILAGHSLGEYTALVCAEALRFEDAVSLVAKRGQYMQQAVPEGLGAMAAIIGLESEQVIEICKQAAQKDVLIPANFNCPGQIVISGDKAAVKRAIQIAEQKGARLAKELAVSVPSHCQLMKPAADKLALELDKIKINLPKIPIIHNVDVSQHDFEEDIKKALIEQLYNSVRWEETIAFMIAKDIEVICECGPGKVLTGLTKRISRNITAITINDSASIEKAREQLTEITEQV